MLEVDGQIAARRIERAPLQVQRPIGAQPVLAASGQKEILARVESEHRAAVERAGVGVLRQQNRVVQDQQRKLADHDGYEALIVSIGRGSARLYAQRSMGLAVQYDDVWHGMSESAAGDFRPMLLDAL